MNTIMLYWLPFEVSSSLCGSGPWPVSRSGSYLDLASLYNCHHQQSWLQGRTFLLNLVTTYNLLPSWQNFCILWNSDCSNFENEQVFFVVSIFAAQLPFLKYSCEYFWRLIFFASLCQNINSVSTYFHYSAPFIFIFAQQKLKLLRCAR